MYMSKNINYSYVREVKVQLEILQFGIGEKFDAKKKKSLINI